jgi:hypothetical protein
VTSGLRITGFHLTSSAGRVRHIVSCCETLGTHPYVSRSAVKSGPFALAEATELWRSSRMTLSSGIGSVITISMSNYLPSRCPGLRRTNRRSGLAMASVGMASPAVASR